MISKPRDWDSAPTYDGGGTRLTPGGHICRILHMIQTTSKAGNPMIVTQFDIDENGEFDGYFMRRFNELKKQNTDENQKTRYPGNFYTNLYNDKGETNPYFKGFIKALEESNPGYKWNWDEKSVEGKKIGLVFREEEYRVQTTGEIKTGIKPFQPRNVQAIRNGVPVPQKKTIPEHAPQPFDPNAGFVAADDEELPF